MKKFIKILLTLLIIIIVAAIAVLYIVPMFETAKESKDGSRTAAVLFEMPVLFHRKAAC